MSSTSLPWKIESIYKPAQVRVSAERPSGVGTTCLHACMLAVCESARERTLLHRWQRQTSLSLRLGRVVEFESEMGDEDINDVYSNLPLRRAAEDSVRLNKNC